MKPEARYPAFGPRAFGHGRAAKGVAGSLHRSRRRRQSSRRAELPRDASTRSGHGAPLPTAGRYSRVSGYTSRTNDSAVAPAWAESDPESKSAATSTTAPFLLP